MVAPRDDEYEVEQVEQEKECQEETGFRQQKGRFTCIVCGRTRNTQSQINKHMQAEGFWDAKQKQTPPNVPNQQNRPNLPVKSVGKSTMKEDLMCQMMNVMNKLMNMQMNQ